MLPRGLLILFSSLLLLGGCNQPYLFYNPERDMSVTRRARGLTVDQIIRLSQAGLAEDLLQEQIAREGMREVVKAKDVERMRKAGVSEKVIREAQKNRPRYIPVRRRSRRYYYYYYYNYHYDSPLLFRDTYPIWITTDPWYWHTPHRSSVSVIYRSHFPSYRFRWIRCP